MLDVLDHGPIRELRLARPPVNALNDGLLGALAAAVHDAPDAGVRALVLSGGPKVFSAGMDLPWLMSLGTNRAALQAAWESLFAAARSLAECPVPVVAAVTGHSPAGGCVLALCCDYRVMARGPFRIGLNEVEVGLVVPAAIQYLMQRVVGVHRAERLLVAGAMLEAQDAQAIGLVDELADVDHVTTRARTWLEDLLAKPPEAMLGTRALARADLVAALRDPERLRLDAFLERWFTPATQAVLRAVLARLKGG